MYVRAAPRTASGPFVASAMVLLAILSLTMFSALWWFRVLTTGLAVALCGLTLDMLGAMTLAGGLILSHTASIRERAAQLTPALLGPTRWARLLARGPVALSEKLGSTDPQEQSPTTVQELVDASWGLALLFLGFVGQAIGAGWQLLR
jgi:hypothetical protein